MSFQSSHPKSIPSYLIHGEIQSSRWDYSHHLVPPVSATATYRLGSVERGAAGFREFAQLNAMPEHPIYIYGRLDEPTTAMLEDRLAAAEMGESAIVFGSGMAAISAIFGLLSSPGDHIISHETIYGCTYSLLTNWLGKRGHSVTFANLVRDDLNQSITSKTRIVFFETPVNPNLDLIDIGAVRKTIDDHNATRSPENKIWLVVDNTFASPVCQRPITLGADIVVQSLTKHISGFGTEIGGAVICPKELHNLFLVYRKDFGAMLSAHSAWTILVYGLPTLYMRQKQECETAMKVAKFLANHPKIDKVLYPGLETFPQYQLAQKQMRTADGDFAPGSLLYFILKGDPEKARANGGKLANWLAEKSVCYSLAVSLGQIKTLIEHPSTMSHSVIPLDDQIKGGIAPGGLRLSLGLEDAHVLIEELDQGLSTID